jgi:hypothetical protein
MLVMTGVFENERFIPDKPVSIPQGTKVVVVADAIVEEAAVQPEKKPVFGCLKGQIWMSDDFDEPLDDFKDYM